MSVEPILRELVAIPSPSAVSNLALLAWVKQLLEANGWSVEVLPYHDDNGVAKANLMARPGSAQAADAIGLAFICHTDTVPFATSWSGALALTESADGAALHGCGACDVKGALACFLAAAEQTAPAQLRPDVALILTADEEIGCRGMERLLAQIDLRIASAIVSEPTSLRAGIAGKGYGLARVTVHGKEAHSAYPGEGISAIALAAQMVARIFLWNDAGRSAESGREDALFEVPRTTVNVGVIEGGTAKNIVAGRCSFLVEWRPIPGEAPEALLTRLEALAEEMRGEEARVRIETELLRAEAGFGAATAGPLQRRLAEIFGERDAAEQIPPIERSPIGISFGSEASRLARVADEVIVIGPGDMHTAHSERECVPRDELAKWTRVLRDLIEA
jgi:acetylornithine deacetylase